MSYFLRERAKPRYTLLVDGVPEKGDRTHADAIVEADHLSRMGQKVEIIASYDNFVTFWTAAKFNAKSVDNLL